MHNHGAIVAGAANGSEPWLSRYTLNEPRKTNSLFNTCIGVPAAERSRSACRIQH